MKKGFLSVLLLFVFGCAGTAVQPLEIPKGAEVARIRITAEKFRYAPDEIRVKEGRYVILELESLDVTHGFSLPDFGVNVTIPEKQKTEVRFLASQSGTFPFRCSHFCGVGHFGMTGTLIVE